MANRQYLVAGVGFVNESTTRQYQVAGVGFVNDTTPASPPPPSSTDDNFVGFFVNMGRMMR